MLGKTYTARGSPNIALIKYWGKRDERLVLPCNSSVSITLSHEALHTTTSVRLSDKLDADAFYLDGVMQDLSEKDVAERFRVVNTMRKLAGVDAHVLVASDNSFPASSGMASSASGIATLVYVMDQALELNLGKKELSRLARQGSGSACRSMFGCLVMWKKGTKPDGVDSYAQQLFSENYWPELVDIIAVTSR